MTVFHSSRSEGRRPLRLSAISALVCCLGACSCQDVQIHISLDPLYPPSGECAPTLAGYQLLQNTILDSPNSSAISWFILVLKSSFVLAGPNIFLKIYLLKLCNLCSSARLTNFSN